MVALNLFRRWGDVHPDFIFRHWRFPRLPSHCPVLHSCSKLMWNLQAHTDPFVIRSALLRYLFRNGHLQKPFRNSTAHGRNPIWYYHLWKLEREINVDPSKTTYRSLTLHLVDNA